MRILGYCKYKFGIKKSPKKINLCGCARIGNFYNVDLNPQADLVIDLEKKLLPFRDKSADTVVCISAINYFSKKRGGEIIKDIFRILNKGGVARFGTQDFFEICRKYVNGEKDFFFQKLPNGKERFKGVTVSEKINEWFYGYKISGGKSCKYFYDFETLALLFKEAGFSKIERKKYRESQIPEIDKIDNRPDQMFFLEAVK